MVGLDRRTFLKLMGQGAAVLGMGAGFSGKAWAAQVKRVPDPDWEEWDFYFPGKYNAADAKVLKKFQEDLAFINNKDINIKDLISGKLDGQPGIDGLMHGKVEGQPGIISVKKITSEVVDDYAARYGGHNPMWTDKNYAEKTKWGAMVMPFAAGEPRYTPAMPISEGIADYFVVTAHNDALNFYRPVYEGDTIYAVIDEQHCTDITPKQGSYYRTFAMSGRARLYNQRAELVAEGANILNESFRRHKSPAMRNPSKTHVWEAPDWWQRSAHIFTDQDWEEIIGIWKNETIRGAEPLYWDEVNIGDEPPPRAVGPVVTEEEIYVIMDEFVPYWNVDTKQNMLDPEAFKKLVKNEQGLYVPPEHLKKKPLQSRPGAAQRENWDGRGHVQNAICAKWAAGMIYNWMGDQGWLQRISWDIMELPPGPTKTVSYQENPTMIPSIPMELRPALFDKYPYLEKVPYMRGCRAAWHALDGDVIISRAYVVNKYRQNDEYFVDLVFWCETIDKYLVEEGIMTVKLPKR